MSFCFQAPLKFAADLIDFLGSEAQVGIIAANSKLNLQLILNFAQGQVVLKYEKKFCQRCDPLFLATLSDGVVKLSHFAYLFRFQYLHSLMALTATELDLKKNQKRLDASVMALEALRNVIKNNAGITCASVTLTRHAIRWGRRLCDRPKA